LRHLQTHIARPTLAGDAAQLRLESDADLVQVVTVHKSKGLQYPLVFLPFASSFRAESDDAPRSDAERLEEDMRLLYVALTRAERGLWLGVAERSGDADGKKPAQSALSVLLGRQGPGDLPQCLARWALCPPEQGQPTIAVHAAPPADTLGYTPPHAPGANQPARVARRVLRRRWWTASFSRLVQAHASGAPFNTLATPGSALDDRLAEAQLDHATPEDDAPPLANAVDGFPAGARHGTLLHDLLQWQCEHGWPLAQPHAHTQAEPPATPGLAAHDAAWQRLIENKKQTVQLDQAQEAVLIPWLRAIVTQPLSVDCGATPGEPLVLAQLQPHQVWAEMAFTLAVPPTDVAWLDRLIQAHLWPGQPRPALQPGELDGMLTGSMDLVLAHGGRYHVLDYKSNRLAGYAPGGASPMLGAMLQHRYDVQLTLYLLALHRLLRQRLPGYAPQRHLGGAVYLFLRGITGSASAAPSTQGVMAVPAPLELLQRIDERWQPGAAPSTGFNGGRA
jgi:exodeoxyribonuclease V beta subunit